MPEAAWVMQVKLIRGERADGHTATWSHIAFLGHRRGREGRQRARGRLGQSRNNSRGRVLRRLETPPTTGRSPRRAPLLLRLMHEMPASAAVG